MATAALGAVGLAVSAGSSLSQISAQKKQARAQEENIAMEQASAQQRMQLAYENAAQRRRNSELAAAEERKVIQTQRVQAAQQMQESKLNDRLAKIQSTLESKGVRSEAERTIAKLLQESSNEVNQLQTTNANELGGLAAQGAELSAQQGDMRTATAGKTGSAMSLSGASREASQLNQFAGAQQQANDNVGTRDFQARNAQGYAQQLGANVNAQAQLASGYMDTTQQLQEGANQVAYNGAARQNALQTSRNLIGSRAQYASAAAANNSEYLSQVMNERSNMIGLSAQQASIQRPSLLSYASVAANTALGAYQNGLLSFGSSRKTNTPNSGLGQYAAYGSTALNYFNTDISTMPPSGGYAPSGNAAPGYFRSTSLPQSPASRNYTRVD